MELGVRDRNFVLVGGTTGMGFGAAHQLAADGANVALLARDEQRAAARAKLLSNQYGVRAVGIGVDAAAPGAGVERAVDRAAAELGPLRGLAVTAGPMNQQGPFLEHGDESWDWYYQVILMATVRSCRAIIPHLQRNGGGTIVNTAAYSVRAPKILIPPYNASEGRSPDDVEDPSQNPWARGHPGERDVPRTVRHRDQRPHPGQAS